MCGASFPDAISSRFSQPKLAPFAPAAVLVATRPCNAGHNTTRAAPPGSDSTTVAVWRCKNSTSSPKLCAQPPAPTSASKTGAACRSTAGPLYHGTRAAGVERLACPLPVLSRFAGEGDVIYRGGAIIDSVESPWLFALAPRSGDYPPDETGPRVSRRARALRGDGCKKKTTDAIAVIPKGTTHEFWKSVHAGAEKAAQELGVKIIWKGPLREDDREDQIKVVENFINMRVNGIVLAPLDDAALVPVVTDAIRARIPVVVFDSGIKTDDIVSFVATDNYRGGKLAGDHLAKLLGGKGKVMMLRYAEGSASTAERERGSSKPSPSTRGSRWSAHNQYGGVTTESAFKVSENLLTAHKGPGGLTVQGIFCPNESTAFAMLRALEDDGFAGKVRFIGFDSSPKMVDAHGQGAHGRHRRAGPDQDGLPGREGDGRSPAGQAGRQAHRHRRHADRARHHDLARGAGAAQPRLQAMVEGMSRPPPRPVWRCAASASASARRWRWAAST